LQTTTAVATSESSARPIDSAAAEFQPAGYTPSYLQITIRYLQTSPIRVKGPTSGRQYEFSGSHPIQLVDTRDAKALLRTGFFRRD
jgi:hypothetical protein